MTALTTPDLDQEVDLRERVAPQRPWQTVVWDDPVNLMSYVTHVFREYFGYARPEGYRKALRAMQLAEKFRRPVICLVDTPAAYPGMESEERGIAEAIAVNLREMAVLNVPILVVVTGEGGSGGALGIAVGDTLLRARSFAE